MQIKARKKSIAEYARRKEELYPWYIPEHCAVDVSCKELLETPIAVGQNIPMSRFTGWWLDTQ